MKLCDKDTSPSAGIMLGEMYAAHTQVSERI